MMISHRNRSYDSKSLSPNDLPAAVISFPADERLNDEEFLWEVARHLGDLPLSRRQIPDWIAEGFYKFPGTIIDQYGCRVALGPDDVDNAFSNEDTFRWVSNFLRMDFLNPKRRKQRLQARVLHRLRLIAASLEIERLAPSFTEQQLAAHRQMRWGDGLPSTLDRPRPQPRRGAFIETVLHYNDVANLDEITCSGISRGLKARLEQLWDLLFPLRQRFMRNNDF